MLVYCFAGKTVSLLTGLLVNCLESGVEVDLV